MVLALLVSGDVVVGVAAVPPELVLLVSGNVHVLEVAIRLLSVTTAALTLLLNGVKKLRTKSHRIML